MPISLSYFSDKDITHSSVGLFFLTDFSPYFFENLDRVSEKCYTESGNRIKISKVLFIFRQRQTKQENFRLHTVE